MYHLEQQDILVAAADAMLSTAAVKFWAPGFCPFHLKGIAVVVTTGVTTTAAVLTVTKRVTAGSNTNEVTIDTITVPVVATAPLGTVLFVDGLDTIVRPGEELEFSGGGEGDAGAGHIVIFGNFMPPDIGNNTDMVRSA